MLEEEKMVGLGFFSSSGATTCLHIYYRIYNSPRIVSSSLFSSLLLLFIFSSLFFSFSFLIILFYLYLRVTKYNYVKLKLIINDKGYIHLRGVYFYFNKGVKRR